MVADTEIPAAQFLSEKPDKAMAHAGVYAIFCDANGKYYVGSSNNIMLRKKQHFNSFARGNHCNSHLKSAHKKYGTRSFLFKVLEFTEKDKASILDCERKWIKDLDSVESGFNIMPHASSPLGCKRTELNKGNMRIAFASRVMGIERRYEFISPSGELFCGSNVARFCRSIGMNGCDAVNMNYLARGKLCSFKGWKSALSPLKKKPSPKGRPYDLISPKGIRFTGSNLRSFAISMGLRPAFFADLINGTTKKTESGWIRHPDFIPGAPPKKQRRLTSPQGIEYAFIKISDFCVQHKLNPHSVQAFLSCNQKSYLGWTKPSCS